MFIRKMSRADVKSSLQSILQKIEIASSNRPANLPKPMLVAVSKTKPPEMIIEAYSCGQRHFGENYIQELVEKGNSKEIVEMCPEIKWHFIGHLQNNKINKLLKIPGLYMVQTVDSEKLANNLNSAWERIEIANKEPLRVLIQVNTSGEAEKNGIKPNEVLPLYKYIRDNLSNLKLEGIMTIGKLGHDYTTGPNPDFISLIECKKTICEELNIKPEEIQVSMGMSDDFERAIETGSTIVRVGSSIFGSRPPK